MTKKKTKTTTNHPPEGRKPGRRRRLLIILASIILFLVIVRIILPYVVLHYANKTLANMNGYYGHVEDIDLAIYRGAYQLNNIYLNKVDSATGKQSPFFDSRVIDLSVEWRALFHGSIVGELVFISPHMNFIANKVEPGQLQKDTTDFRVLLKKFMPIKVNRFEIQNGILEYIDEGSSPKVDVKLTNAQVIATNLRNSYDSTVLLPSTVRAHADVYEGTLSMNMKLNPLADRPTFDLDVSVDGTNLVLLNDFFQAYGKFDVHRGTFGLYSEVAAKEGKFSGYVKPIIKDLDVVGPEDRNDNFLHKLWEGMVGAAGVIFRNQSKNQVATKIPMEGDLSKPTIGTWTAIVEVLRNAFIQALFPAIDNAININTVGKSNTPQSPLQKEYEKSKPAEEKENDKKKKDKNK